MVVRVWDGLYLPQLAPTPIPGEGANHPTPRAQFHANERKEGRDANPQPQERNSTPTSARRGEMLTPKAQFHPNERGTNPPKRTRKSRGQSIHSCTRSITIIPPAPHLHTPQPQSPTPLARDMPPPTERKAQTMRYLL